MEDKNETLTFPENNNSIKSSISSKKSSSKKLTKSSKKGNDFESEDISVSQLELMANKKKIKKDTELASIKTSEKLSERANEKEYTRKKSSSSSSLSVSSETDTEKEKKRARNASRENKIDSIRKEKCEFLYKLEKLSGKNKWRGMKMDMNNTLEQIRNEYERVSNEMKTERSVAFFKRMLLLGVQGIEMLNTRFDPMGVDLDGWSEAMGYSLENQEYDEVMAELYEKYKGAGQMSPEMKLIFMIVSSATMFTISKKITKMDPENTIKSLLGNFMGQQAQQQPQQYFQPPQQHPQQHPQQYYQQPQQQFNIPSANDIRNNNYEVSETTEDIRPSKLKGPANIQNGDGIDINNILKTMNDRKKEKDKEMEKLIDSLKTDTSDDVFKSISLNNRKRGRGRPKKGNAAKV